MARSNVYRWPRRLAAALLALAAALACAPRAMASCGDYITMAPGHGQATPYDLPSFPQFDPDRRSADDSPAHLELGAFAQPRAKSPAPPCQRCPSEPGQPCRGPWCSGSPVPQPAPPTTVDHVQQHWACWWAVRSTVDGGYIGLHTLHDEQDRVHHVFPIYHPPRPI